MTITFKGYKDTERCTWTLDEAGRLIETAADGTETAYNDEYYTEEDYSLIRTMLIADGARLEA